YYSRTSPPRDRTRSCRRRWEWVLDARRTDRLTALAQLLSPSQDVLLALALFLGQHEMQTPDVADRPGEKVFGDEIDRRILIPRGPDRLERDERFVCTGRVDKFEFVLAVVQE